MLAITPYSTLKRPYIVISLWSAFWWCLGMLAFYDHDIFHSPAELSLEPHPEPGRNIPLSRSVWGVSFVILAGLIVTAYYFRPQGKEIAAPSLAIIADDKERPFGAANPVLTSHVTGLEYGDAQESAFRGEPSLCSAAVLESPPGTYPIAVGPGTGGTNEEKYRLRFVPGSLRVIPASTQTSLASSGSTATTNSPVTFTATIAPQVGGTPTGTVTFYADAAPLGAGTLASGTTSYTALGLPPGAHLISAEYSGDTNFSSSTSPKWTQQITLPEVRPPVPKTSVIPAGTPIFVALVHPIDSNSSKPNQPLIATLAAPLVADGHLLARKGSMVILGLTDMDPDGRVNGKPALTIHLVRLEVAGKAYQPDLTLRMQGVAPGPAGRIHIPPATILTFKLQSPIITDVPISPVVAKRATAR